MGRCTTVGYPEGEQQRWVTLRESNNGVSREVLPRWVSREALPRWVTLEKEQQRQVFQGGNQVGIQGGNQVGIQGGGIPGGGYTWVYTPVVLLPGYTSLYTRSGTDALHAGRETSMPR